MPREDAITVWNLADLERLHSDRVTTVPFTGREEAVNGADWEWWFHTSDLGFGMRIQAKRAMPGGAGYRLEYHPRPGQRQSDLLVRDALDNNCIPAYVLYNHRNWVPRVEEGLPVACAHGPGETSHLGCTIVSAFTVHAAPDSPAFVRDRSMPWNRVLCDGRTPTALSSLEATYKEARELHARGLDDLATTARAGEPPGTNAPVPMRLDNESASPARVNGIFGEPRYAGAHTLTDRPLQRLPGRVLDMIRRPEPTIGPDGRAEGAVLFNLG
ncbi:DUF6615 family protein [Kitasatospora sp. SC0581]|uniref:DUF6615 family protein n=1 Tax=Kitasatospora sp. SC0581 TaxID=3394360 RepID=UPI003A88341F